MIYQARLEANLGLTTMWLLKQKAHKLIAIPNQNEQALDFTCAFMFCMKIFLKEMQIYLEIMHLIKFD